MLPWILLSRGGPYKSRPVGETSAWSATSSSAPGSGRLGPDSGGPTGNHDRKVLIVGLDKLLLQLDLGAPGSEVGRRMHEADFPVGATVHDGHGNRVNERLIPLPVVPLVGVGCEVRGVLDGQALGKGERKVFDALLGFLRSRCVYFILFCEGHPGAGVVEE